MGNMTFWKILRVLTTNKCNYQCSFCHNEGQNKDSNYNLFLNFNDYKIIIDSLKYTTPKGKIVYGGGGIIPDVFVPIDTLNSYSNRLYGRLNDFTFEYIDTHRSELDEWELNDFVENFDKDNHIFDQYLDQLDLNSPISPESKANLKMYFNAIIARSLFEDIGYFIITQANGKMILKVLELESGIKK